MGLYRQKNSHHWWLALSHNGKQIRRSTGTTNRRQAEAILAKVKTQLVEGKWFETDQLKTRTFGELVTKYFKERSVQKSERSAVRDRSCWKHLQDFFGDCTLYEVTPSRINEYKQARLAVANPQTVVKELGVLKNAFNLAIREWEWCKENPVSRIKMPPLPPGRARYLKPEELERLVQHAEDWFRPILLFAANTGMRKGNILGLAWEQVDLDRRAIVLEHTKNGERLAVPINDTVLRVLGEQRTVRMIGSNRVFHRHGHPLNDMTIQRALETACGGAGITDFRFHDLRHTCASTLVQNGVDLYVVQKLLGHKDSRMTQRYAHLAQERLAKAVGTLDKIYHSPSIVGEKEKELQAVAP